jgi:hypothetical protein
MARYVIARNFMVPGDQMLQYGEIAPPEIEASPNLLSLVSAHYLYALPDEGDGAWLPPHLYSQVVNIQMRRGFIREGEPPNLGINWTKPPAVERSEELLDVEAASHEANRIFAEQKAQRVIERERTFRLSPRPVELPPEKVLIDSKYGEAMSSGTDHIIPPDEVEVPDEVADYDPYADEDQPVPAEPGEPAENDEENDNDYTRADLQELGHTWNDDHPDDRIALNQSKAELEAALRERGAL